METNQKRKLSIFLLLAAMLAGFSTKAAGEPEKMITVMVHATECNDAPAKGAKVVIIDAGWEDNLASGITNNAGDCSIKVRVGYNIVVQATYKDEVKKTSYFATDEKYGKQIVLVKFDDNCGDGYPEKLSVKERGAGNSDGDAKAWESAAYYTYDNYGLRVRQDAEWTSKDEYLEPEINITDYMNCRTISWARTGDENKYDWFVAPIDNCHPEDYDLRKPGASLPGVNFITAEDEKGLSLYESRKPDEQVAGKTCRVYASKDGSHKIYIWKRVVMREIVNGEVINEVLAITENVPASAFSKTKEHGWIK